MIPSRDVLYACSSGYDRLHDLVEVAREVVHVDPHPLTDEVLVIEASQARLATAAETAL